MIKGNVGWLDNLKISLIMCKLFKRSIWCYCYIDGKDLIDVYFLIFLFFNKRFRDIGYSFKRESENYFWYKFKNLDYFERRLESYKVYIIRYLFNFDVGNLGFVIGERGENLEIGFC